MRKSLRYATVLFVLSLLSIMVALGTDMAVPLGVGGPLEDVALFSGVDGGRHGTPVSAADSLSSSSAAFLGPHFANSFFIGDEEDGPAAEGAGSDGSDVAMTAATVLRGTIATDEPEPEPEPRPTVVTHVIQSGETLWDIARMYDIDVDTIVAANDWVDANRLRIGDKLTVLTVRGALHTVQRGESLWDISRTYGVSIDEIAATNSINDPSRLQIQTRLVIPGAQAQAAALRRDAVVSTDGRLIRNFEWPLRGRISSRYGLRWGRTHHGLDIAVPIGTPIRAAAGGIVSFSGAQGGYGNIVIIDHGNGVETRYAHNSRNTVSRGQRVQRGALIAYSGNTGNSTGPHLHFEIRLRGQSVNPETYLK